jgi:hypothetical protein
VERSTRLTRPISFDVEDVTPGRTDGDWLGKLDTLLRKNWSPRVQLLLEIERSERLSELRQMGLCEAAFEDASG